MDLRLWSKTEKSEVLPDAYAEGGERVCGPMAHFQ